MNKGAMQSISWMGAGIALTVGVVFIIDDVRSTFFSADSGGEEIARLEVELAKRDSHVKELERLIQASESGYLSDSQVINETFEKIQDASVRNQERWVTVAETWKGENVQLAEGQEALVQHFMLFIDTVAKSMVDPMFENSLYNDFLKLIPDEPLLYSGELIDLQERYAKEAAYLWPLFLCDFVRQNYVQSGFVEGESASCVKIQREFQEMH